jgi:hypothetical protein
MKRDIDVQKKIKKKNHPKDAIIKGRKCNDITNERNLFTTVNLSSEETFPPLPEPICTL